MTVSGEMARLAAVSTFRGLRHERSPAFDYIAKLAMEHFKVPIALVSIVDKDEQWFAGMKGISASCTPRSQAFCAYTIQSDEVMIVEDARKDPRFRDNPLVTGEPFIRFYAGAPLIFEEGTRLGSVCIIDREPRTLTVGQRVVLTNLAKVAMDEMRLKKAA